MDILAYNLDTVEIIEIVEISETQVQKRLNIDYYPEMKTVGIRTTS